MTKKKIILDLPPSGNHRLMPKNGRLITTSTYRQWKDSASWQIKAQLNGDLPIAEPVMSLIRIVYKNNRRSDYDNVIKCINDALTQGGAIADDNLIKCAFTYCDNVNKESGGKVEIELYPLAEVKGIYLNEVQQKLSDIMATLAPSE